MSMETDSQIEKLQMELAQEKEKNAILEKKVLELKERIIDLSTKSEAEEEAITIKLMKRMNNLKQEKEQLMKQVDIEEDHITNKLLKKLDELQREKYSLEQKLEYEQECIVNRLHRQIQAIHREKDELRTRLREDTQVLLHTIHSSIDLLQQARSASATPAFGPRTGETPSELDDLPDVVLPPSAVPTIPIQIPSPLLNVQAAQEKVLEGEKKMKELLTVVDNMEKLLNSEGERETLPSIVNNNTTMRLRTGSISSNRSRSNSIIGRDKSRHSSFCQ